MAAREGRCDSDVRGSHSKRADAELGLTNLSRTTTKESRLPEYLSTFDAPRLTDEDIALIDEAGAKEHRRQFVRAVILD